MKKVILAALAVAAIAGPAVAQPAQAPETPSPTISIYRAAPGHQIQLLQWLARQDEAARAAGLPASQLYVHQTGASWDYLLIAPGTTDEQDQAVEAASRRLGVTTGPRAGIELRQHLAEHTDTIVSGPTTAAAVLARIQP